MKRILEIFFYISILITILKYIFSFSTINRNVYEIIVTIALLVIHFRIAFWFYKEYKVRSIFYLICMSMIFLLASKLLDFFSFNYLIYSFIWLIYFSLTIIWNIKIILMKSTIKTLKILKLFSISIIISLMINFLSGIFLIKYNLSYLSMINMLYILPFIILCIFFIKDSLHIHSTEAPPC